MGEHLTVSKRGPVATVMMARPEVHNAFNEALIAELHAAFQELGADEGVRVIVLAGEGKSFSAGADLDWMTRMAAASEAANRADSQRLAAMLRAIAECPKPVVARVQGAAMGGGAGLTAAADIAVAAESADVRLLRGAPRPGTRRRSPRTSSKRSAPAAPCRSSSRASASARSSPPASASSTAPRRTMSWTTPSPRPSRRCCRAARRRRRRSRRWSATSP